MTAYMIHALCTWLAVANLMALCLMGWDKSCAQKHKRRIPEKTLFLWAIIGGSLGANLGMQLFRHKTKHVQFVVGMPLILVAHIAIGVFLIL